MVEWTNWIANYSPLWAAYCSIMAARLVTLDKYPVLIPVGTGELCRRLVSNIILQSIGAQAKE